MPWPRGVPRVGHVNKDGSVHAKWGSKVKAPVATAGTKTAKSAGVKGGITIRKVSADMIDAPSVKSPDMGGIKNARDGRPVTAPCPKCGHAYADGGYCPQAEGGCGWSQAVKVIPWTGDRGKK